MRQYRIGLTAYMPHCCSAHRRCRCPV